MKKYGLIGRSLGHSFSKQFFTDYFVKRDINAVYDNYELSEIDQVIDLLKTGCSGFNVTIPYKESVMDYLDELSPEARAIGAVNVIAFNDGKSIGHNTDAYGFHQSIKPFLTNKHERAVVFGTGGASKAVEYALKSIGVDVIFVSRTPVGENEFSYEEVNHHMLKACKLLVNCTPVGTSPNVNDLLPIPYEFLTEDHLVVDLIYNPQKTAFLKQAEKHDALILNGESMLKQQALKSWEIWNS